MEKRYYYKSEDNKGYMSLKTPLENENGFIEISESEFNEHLKELEDEMEEQYHE